MNADIITHAILYNTKKVRESIVVMEECVSIMRKACVCKEIVKRLNNYQNQYRTVATALIKEYDVSEQNKANRFIVLEELIYLIFDCREKNKRLFNFENKKKTIRLLYEKQDSIKKLLQHNEFTISTFIDRYKLAIIFAYVALTSAIILLKTMASINNYDAISFFLLYMFEALLFAICLTLCMVFVFRERSKGRFIRPTTKDKIMIYIGYGLVLLVPIISFFWDRFQV